MRKAQARACICLVLLLAFSTCGFALDPSLDVSQYAHTAWKIREGFTRGSIFAIAQTPDGYLWLGTELGLVRFDGAQARSWQPPDGEQLPDSFIHKLLVSRDGTLWIGTAKGLASWKDGQLTRYAEAAGHAVHSLAEGAEGTIWFGVSNPGRLCAVRVDKTECYGEGNFGWTVAAIFTDHKGNLWVSAPTGLWRWAPGPPERYTLPGDGIQAHAFVEDKNGVLVMATSKSGPLFVPVNGSIEGLKQFVGGKIGSYPLPVIGGNFRPTRMLRSSDGSLWVGTLHGLLHVNQGRIDRFSTNDGLSGDIVTHIFEDREDDVWVSTETGLDRFRDFAVPTISVKQGLSNGAVDVVDGTPDGSIWIATAGELNRWQNGHVTVYGKRSESVQNRRNREQDPILSARVTEIANSGLRGTRYSLGRDDQGRLWVASPEGVFYFSGDRFVLVPGVPGGGVLSIAGDGQGKVWISNIEEGLFYLRPESPVQHMPWSRFGHKYAAESLLPDRAQGGLWLGFVEGGIAYLKDGQIRSPYNVADGLGNGPVSDLQFGSDGALWVATEGGLSRVKDGHVTTLSSRNGLPCDAVQWVVEDDDHSLWLDMPCGLVRIVHSEFDAWASDPKRTVKSMVFDSFDGVWSRGRLGHRRRSVAKSPDGKIWFAPPDGVSVIDPYHLAFNKIPPPVHIEKFIADDKTYDVSNGTHLPALVRNLAIDYTALSLAVPEKVHFRYKLEGQDKNWREVVNVREAHYTNLPPKHYRFRVMACNNSGVWNEEGATLDFVIPPAWYQTNWFRGLCVATFVAFVWGLYLLRMQQVRREEKKLREAIETIPTMAWMAGRDGKVQFVNRRWMEYTGLSDIKNPDEVRRVAIHPEDLERIERRWSASFSSGEPFEEELRYRRTDGEYRWFLSRAVPLRDKRGKVARWYGTSTDIEDRKRAEQLQADLAHTNRVSMLGELAASISHELKQPITATIVNARTSLRWLKREQPDFDELRQAAERIEKDGARASEIIDRLRSLYKKTPPQRELIDLNEIIREMVALLRGEANRVAVSIRTELTAELPKITADRVQLQQVLMNLMLNGIEAMKDTGGVLAVKSQPEDGHVLISISDTGVGLPADKPDRIFDAFYTTKPQGSGMGLAISRSIIESHGGRLWATPNEGRGASFHFSLPTAVHAAGHLSRQTENIRLKRYSP